ncbi:hypothetical protein AVEN_202231-1 [Araneus ventricosus]|uniref:Uncharacterized protein n=1 Tax=Araneus ventricosus TaxID=182803 RepID=A0A4Y2L508_ARAVE|nr:hypothetical protein AVEN_202231-1 [Araneus ventricosus]
MFKTFVAAFASAIEGPGSSCSSSISEDKSTIELFLFTNATISSSLTSPADQKVPLSWLTPGQVSTWGGGEIETVKNLAYCFFIPLIGLAATNNLRYNRLGTWSFHQNISCKRGNSCRSWVDLSTISKECPFGQVKV